jgi:mannose-1-phosphate guanylyltransferase
VEKPQEFVGDEINAGIYLLDVAVLDKIPLRFCMIEKEIFPRLAEERSLYSLGLTGFWRDIGQPEDFLRGQLEYL